MIRASTVTLAVFALSGLLNVRDPSVEQLWIIMTTLTLSGLVACLGMLAAIVELRRGG